MRPVDAKWPVSQTFGSFPTAGVIGNWNGSTVQRLVAQYGNYQPFGHAGEDIACPIGTPVHAIADGVVVWADWGTNLPGDDSDWGYRQRWYLYKSFPGIVTVIQHDGWLSVYGHLSSNDAAPKGTRVKEGQVIGLSGNTGGVAPHLHVAAIVDTSYRTGGGLIYGCTDPSKFYGSLSFASESITALPLEDFMATLTDQEKKWMFDVLGALSDNAATKKDLRDVVEPRTLDPNEKRFTLDVLTSLADNVATKRDVNQVAGDVARVAAQAASTGATEDQIKEAVKQALSESVVKVDVSVEGASK